MDGEYECSLPIEVVLQERVKVGQDVSEERLQRLLGAAAHSAAYNKALGYLSLLPRTRAALAEYLARKGFEEQTTEEVCARLKRAGLLNDAEYCRMYAEQNAGRKGARRIEYELLARGATAETAQAATDDITEEQSAAAAEALAEKYLRGKEISDKTLAGLQRFLLYRGFSYETVGAVLRRAAVGAAGQNERDTELL